MPPLFFDRFPSVFAHATSSSSSSSEEGSLLLLLLEEEEALSLAWAGEEDE